MFFCATDARWGYALFMKKINKEIWEADDPWEKPIPGLFKIGPVQVVPFPRINNRRIFDIKFEYKNENQQ
jgi:hypothetical protein